MKKISIIVAIAENRAIGKNNQLLWHISDDLKRFKKLTTGHTVIMGKKTFESLPVRPLPNRENIVISDNLSDNFAGCVTVYSIEEALAKCSDTGENFIIGGGSVYKQFLEHARKIYLTRVHQNFEADIFFPEFDMAEWQETERSEKYSVNGLSYTYITYEKIST
jgi:dihydrofolate reductase